jgi:hypothetical protein
VNTGPRDNVYSCGERLLGEEQLWCGNEGSGFRENHRFCE